MVNWVFFSNFKYFCFLVFGEGAVEFKGKFKMVDFVVWLIRL